MVDRVEREYRRLLSYSILKARKLGLDLSTTVELIDAEDIDPFERGSERSQSNIRKLKKPLSDALDSGFEWPAKMPLPVVVWDEDENRFYVVDGSHRIHAAKSVGYQKIPVIMIDTIAFDTMVEAEDAIEGTTWIDALGLVDPIMRKNLTLGLPK